MMAPAVGGPASVANEQRVSTMPNRTPIFCGSFVRLAKDGTNVPWLAPIASPKQALKMYMLVREVTPTQANNIVPTKVVAMMNTLIGPQ